MLDGACKPAALAKKAHASGMEALAITDHGCMFGVVEFYSECLKVGVKPILGMEAYMAPGHRGDKSTPTGSAGEAAFHLLLLAADLEGYKNLIKLSSRAYREGFYYKPRIDKEILREHNRGLIVTSACLGGEMAQAFMKRDAKTARHIAETYLEIFGPERFFIEVQKQGVAEQDAVNPELIDLARKMGVGIVGTNDVHFLNQDDHHPHGCLCCISMNKQINDESRLKYSSELYLKTPQEMSAALADYPEAISNTLRIARMCNVELDFSKRYAPVYKVPKDKLRDTPHAQASVTTAKPESASTESATTPANAATPAVMKDDERYLRQLCEDGLVWRYGKMEVSPVVRQRLQYELSLICLKNFCSYFLIVWDFCNYARDNGIPVGARGSGVGTMVGYLLGLCNVDPIQYGLLFERFMDPSRNEMPDIDIDICQEGRQKVIEYVREKYGHVAQIITFGTLAAKAACKDVGRVLGVPLSEIDKLTKLIPGTPGMTLDKALDHVPDLRAMYKENPTITQVIDIAKRLEGLCRNSGVHAAGVIIADQPLDDVIPLCRDKDGNVLTQFEGPISEKCGLLKMDFLGLRTLTTLTRSIELVKRTKGLSIDIEKIDFADKKVLETFGRGETRGIFQFESGGMQDLLMRMQPDRLEDLIAANALYRPGPMELIPTYCNRKHAREPVPSIHPIMDAILKETYGIMVYQEQVMQIFNQLGGIELSNSYKLIKAISKKASETIAKFKPDFLKGTMNKGVSKQKAEEIFDHILKFGGYGFNKSHSTRYAIVAFQTAYMKTYHPVEYMSAVLTFEMGDTTKVVEYIDECRKLTGPDGTRGIKVLPPDVNVSDMDFTPSYVEKAGKGKRKVAAAKEGVIRFGLMAVRGVGEKAVETIIAERAKAGPFRSLYDFCERVDLRAVSRSTIEALVKCGAFSGAGEKRASLLHVLDRAVEMGQQAQSDRKSGQMAMFGAPAQAPVRAGISTGLPDIPELPKGELLKLEKELLGFYITSHPLTDHEDALLRYATSSTREAVACSEGTEVMIGAMINKVKKVITRNGKSAGKAMAILTLEDLDGQIDATMFAETFAEVTAKYPDAVAVESIVLVRGKVDKKRETPSLLVNEVIPIELAVDRLTTSIGIKLDKLTDAPADLEKVRSTLQGHKGTREVYIKVQAGQGQRVTLRLDRDLSVKPSKSLVDELEATVGAGRVELGGDGMKRRRRLQQQALFAEASAAVDPVGQTDVVAVMDQEMQQV